MLSLNTAHDGLAQTMTDVFQAAADGLKTAKQLQQSTDKTHLLETIKEISSIWEPSRHNGYMDEGDSYTLSFVVDVWTLLPYVIVAHLIPKPWASICCYNSFHWSGQDLRAIRFLVFEQTAMICTQQHLSSQVLMLANKVWLTVFQFSPRVFDGVSSHGYCTGPLHTKLRKLFLYGPGLVDWGKLKQETIKGTSPKHEKA